MVSTERWMSSSSSRSSSAGSWGSSQDSEDDFSVKSVNCRDDNSVDVREVARRVLQDLDKLCIDPEDESDSDDDESGSDCEWGSEVSGRRQTYGRRAGGMTLEELTVAVNASIEYHRPTKPAPVRPLTKPSNGKANKHPSSAHDKYSSRNRPRRKQVVKARAIPPRAEEAALEAFQELLERKRRAFYARDKPAEDYKHPVSAPQITPIVTLNEQPQTVPSEVSRQAAATKSESLRSAHAASFSMLEVPSPAEIVPLRVDDGYSTPFQHHLYGPTIADLDKRSSGSDKSDVLMRLSMSGFSTNSPPSLSPWTHKRRSSSNQSKGSSARSSDRSNKSSNNSPTNSSNSTRNEKRQARHASPLAEQRKQDQSTKSLPPSPVHNKSPAPQMPSSPAFVKWELDLSNFTP